MLPPFRKAACRCRLTHSEGKQHLEVCCETDPGAKQVTLEQLKEQGRAKQVQLPCLTKDMVFGVLRNSRRSVSQSQLASYDSFTQEFGRKG